jgi:hypothetical protein
MYKAAVFTLQLSGQIHSPCFISTNICSVDWPGHFLNLFYNVSLVKNKVVLSCLEAGRLVVLVQVGLECEGLVTPLTRVVLESRVCLHVCSAKEGRHREKGY